MNGTPEVNPLRIIPSANDFSYRRLKSNARLTVVPGLLLCSLRVVAAYHGKANPTSRGPVRPFMQTKLTTLISRTHLSLASVFLAFSFGLLLFGCATTDRRPHAVTQVTPQHQVNLQAREQRSQTKNPAANSEIAPPAHNSESQSSQESWPFSPEGDD